MTRMTSEQLEAYKQRLPHLFQATVVREASAHAKERSSSLVLAPLERHIQVAIVTALRLHGFTVWEVYKGSARGGSIWTTKGIPDLIVLRLGIGVVFLEVKRPIVGRLSSDQQQRHEEAKRAGVPVFVVTSVTEALTTTEEIQT